MKLSTIRVERGQLARIPRGKTPTVALALDDDESLMSVTLREQFVGRDRKTVDWTYEAIVAKEQVIE